MSKSMEDEFEMMRCNSCSKYFVSQQNLDIHKKTHTEEKESESNPNSGTFIEHSLESSKNISKSGNPEFELNNLSEKNVTKPYVENEERLNISKDLKVWGWLVPSHPSHPQMPVRYEIETKIQYQSTV